MSITHDPATSVDLDPRRKRALFRAWHRGMREMDLVMGRFADREMASLSEAELDEFEQLMELPDPEVYDWICERAAPAPEHDTPLLARLREYRAGEGAGTREMDGWPSSSSV